MKTITYPKVSVIIPAYNEEKYITDTLNALIRQDYRNFEIIIVNNASTDKTEEVVKEFISLSNTTSPNITIAFEGRQGTNYAREHARKLATGSVIAQLDADCVPGTHWISSGVKLLQRKNVVAVTGPYYYFDGGFFMRFFSLLCQILTYPFVNLIVQLSKRGAILIGGNAFIDAGVLEKAGGYNTNLTFYGDDVDVAHRVSLYGWVSYSNILTLHSSSRRYNAMGFFKVNKKYQQFFWGIIFKRHNNLQQTLELQHPR